jgi:hypothetical protein
LRINRIDRATFAIVIAIKQCSSWHTAQRGRDLIKAALSALASSQSDHDWLILYQSFDGPRSKAEAAWCLVDVKIEEKRLSPFSPSTPRGC